MNYGLCGLNMRILGVDPGLVRTGYGLVEADGPENMKLVEAGAISTNPSDGISVRVRDIYNNIIDIITEYDPGVIVLEKLYSHSKHPVTSMLMGHARGVICLACGVKNVKLVNYPATRIKKAVTGNGRASKQQVRETVKAALRLKSTPKEFDVSDALAMALSYVYIERRRGLAACR